MQIQDTKAGYILFVCAGNTCRSPMAKALASRFLSDDVYVESAGLDTASESGATPEAIQVMLEDGIDISSHHSQNISELEFTQWHIVVAMTPRIAKSVVASDLISTNHLVEWNVVDPYGQGIEAYRRCVSSIKSLLPDLLTLSQKDSQDAPSSYSVGVRQNPLELRDYLDDRMARIKSGEITDGSHLDGIAATALRKFEEALRYNISKILKENNFSYDIDIRGYIDGNVPFGKLTLGKLIKCYEILVTQFRFEPQVEFAKGSFKTIDSALLKQMRKINQLRTELIHQRAIDKDKAILLLGEVISVVTTQRANPNS